MDTRSGRIAVLADVHGNVEALRAVLRAVAAEGIERFAVCGDLSWGPQPRETIAVARALPDARFVRGNAERALLDLAAGERAAETERDAWMLAAHAPDDVAFLRGFAPTQGLAVDGLGTVLFCHGSPRSDHECITPRTPDERLHEAAAGVDADLVVTAHIHVQSDRVAAGRRWLNPGSVGLPYEGAPGARWAILGPDVELRCTPYDLDAVVAAYRATDDPRRELMVELLLTPPTRDEMIADAEARVFAD